MSKKNGGKRLNKRTLQEMLQTLFQQNPNETFSFKQVFKQLKLDTHPAKMMAIDMMEEMAWDDYLSKVSDNSYRLNLKTQVQEGTFIRKANGKNSFQPDDGGTPVFVSERNSLFAMNGDRVRVAYMARRAKHIKEAMVVEILSHKRDQAVGRLKVEKDYAFLVTEGNIFVHDVLIPKKKLKGGKTGDKAVVKITQWPSKDSKNIVGEVIDILGKEGDNNVEMHAILAQYGLPYKYPKSVEDAAEKIDPGITPEEISRREDFRDVFTCTIDPKDAKDFDDALSIRVIENGERRTERSDYSQGEKANGIQGEQGNHTSQFSPLSSQFDYVSDCSLESDLELYFPDQYVPSDSERMLLYRELDGLQTDQQLEAYRRRLIDRFGQIPHVGEELMRVVPLRRLGKSLGCEKIMLKQGRMSLYFVSNPDSPYYQSAMFDRILQFVGQNLRRCNFREVNGKRSMSIADIPTVDAAVQLLAQIIGS